MSRDSRARRTSPSAAQSTEHLYQREIANAAELAEEVAAYLVLYNEIRPHESLGLETPLSSHCGDTPISGQSLQDP